MGLSRPLPAPRALMRSPRSSKKVSTLDRAAAQGRTRTLSWAASHQNRRAPPPPKALPTTTMQTSLSPEKRRHRRGSNLSKHRHPVCHRRPLPTSRRRHPRCHRRLAPARRRRRPGRHRTPAPARQLPAHCHQQAWATIQKPKPRATPLMMQPPRTRRAKTKKTRRRKSRCSRFSSPSQKEANQSLSQTNRRLRTKSRRESKEGLG